MNAYGEFCGNKKISIKNFRGIQNADFDFCNKVNLIVGINGAGKTSVLDSIALLLSWLINRTLNKNSSGQPINDLSIRNGCREAALSITVNYDNQDFNWMLVKTGRGLNARSQKSELSLLAALSKRFQIELDNKNDEASLPLFVYYPVDRAIVKVPIRRRRRQAFSQLSAYDEALNPNVNFKSFFEWFRFEQEKHNSSLANLLHSMDLSDTDSLLFKATKYRKTIKEILKELYNPLSSKGLKAVCQAIYEFMPGFSDLRVLYEPLRMVIEKEGVHLNLLQLSGGEKCMLALIGDIARRLVLANPSMDNPLKGKAIILIDEIDLHLHPRWQKNIIERLNSTFPNCQFIITTHSPHIITHVHSNCISIISTNENGAFNVSKARNSYGFSSEVLLSEIMGLDTTRPQKIQDKLDKIFQNISDNELDEAETKLQCLKTIMRDDPDVVKAEALIFRKKIINK
ncbi:AAA family ATPase [Zymomonas mobilis]|uniref:SMC domain protein n=1 Tax=Zymomonas mobilis subsp. mobilis (strain ATCC 10988 / DSM 424 / LMG 404 / NCIMB 8938 / NRRL B-806 / ZM1) TaxID=555217 RepID=A0A0H3G0N6_ZYMMA|nr:AAA family ATPase [Zymomonas mobilis]AEH63591.1 SMC domain protein [Zymomonas mobilis subsp. mobilis ATCC 10988]